MPVDFLDAHTRHKEDAAHLESDQRWANADHLYGMSAECGLKALMAVFGMPTTGGDPDDWADRKHIDELWDRYEAYRSGHQAGPEYQLTGPNPFATWRAKQRYHARTGFTQATVAPHRMAAITVAALVQQARGDGHLP